MIFCDLSYYYHNSKKFVDNPFAGSPKVAEMLSCDKSNNQKHPPVFPPMGKNPYYSSAFQLNNTVFYWIITRSEF